MLKEKYSFVLQRIEYLGHYVEDGCLIADQKKVSVISQRPEPNNMRELLSFLDLMNYYNRFIKDFSDIGVFLTVLLQKHTIWSWGLAQQEAFDTLKIALFNPLVLQLSRFQHDLEVTIDASKFPIGETLIQDNSKGLKPVQYSSRKFSSAESRYPLHNRMLLAIVSDLKRF